MRPLLVLLGLCLTACTQDFSVFEGDAAPLGDATTTDASDASMPEAGKDAPGVDGGMSFACNGSPVSDCSQCSGSPEPCVYCSTSSSGVLAGVCQQVGSCIAGAPSGFGVCVCAGGNPASCPEPYEICRNGFCRTCSEAPGNANYTCQGGGKCNPADGGCF